MKRPLLGAALAAIASLVLSAPSGLAAGPQRASRERQVVVSVVDRDGAPISGLTPADFVVREDDVAREVLRVEQAAAPMQIVLLADTSGSTGPVIQDLRKGLQAFARAVWAKSPETEIALMEFGERPMKVVDFTRTFSVLDRGVGRLFEHSGGGAYLLEAILDAAKALKTKEARRPVIVAFGSEASTEFSPQTYQDVETALKGSRAALWAIDLSSAAGPSRTDEARNRGIVLGDVTTRSGGMQDTLLDRMTIEKRFQDVAGRLTSQYAVVYGRPESLIPPTKLDVAVKRQGARVLAPHWTGQ
jgi:VWFA-related protein